MMPPASYTPPLQVRINEAARLLGYAPRTIRLMLQRGELRSVGQGRLRRIAMDELKRWQERNTN